MIALVDVDERLALFAEGICGRYLHIKSSDVSSVLGAEQTRDALYLPPELAASEPHAYHVLVLQQIGYRECGTYDFRMSQAIERLGLEPPASTGHMREGDLTQFFAAFDRPAAARALFLALEEVRINAHIHRAYPGARKYMAQHLAALPIPASDPLIEEIYWFARQLADDLLELEPLLAPEATVYDSAHETLRLYPELHHGEITPIETEEVSGAEWMQREARLEDWQEELAEATQQILAVEMLEAEEAQVLDAEDLAGDTRDTSIDLRAMKEQRDTIKRRIDMERATLRHATGEPRSDARSYRYDEWDYHHRRYLTKYCRLYEERIVGDAEEEISDLRKVIQTWHHAVKSQLEQMRPLGMQRVRRVIDGDELDLNAVLEARQDVRAGISPDERTYSRRERVNRDVCAVFLIDLSASTDDPIEPPELPEYDEWGDPVNLRDPFEDHPMFADNIEEPPAEVRKIIDVQKEAMLVMAAALDTLGDNFGVYGFSGYGHDCVEIFVAKEIGEAFSASSLRAIGGMSPKRSTRMGPAIRHATAKLAASGHAMKVLIILSDGFPQDCDYGPDRGEHEYGLQDTAKALSEAAQKGVENFCITVDRSGHDYLKRMCTENRYMVIEEMEDLPGALSKVYSTLTAR